MKESVEPESVDSGNRIKVELVTHAGRAHVGACLVSLAHTETCAEVVLADGDKKWNSEARRVLGAKLTRVYRDPEKMLSDEKLGMVLVTMEAKLAPPVVDAALEAGSHVFSEKPACVRVEDSEPLARKADSKHRHLMLARVICRATTTEITVRV